MNKSWERQPHEGPEAFEAFAVYRDLGPSRSLRMVARSLNKSASLIARWSTQHHWQQRVGAWDAHCDESAQDAYRTGAADEARERGRVLSRQVEVLGAPAAELAKRLGANPAELEQLTTRELFELATRSTRSLVSLVEAEREFLQDLDRTERDAAQQRIDRMSRAELEEYLVGIDPGLANGADSPGD